MTFQCWSVMYMSFAFLVYASWNAIHCIQVIIKEEFYNWQRCIFFCQLVCKSCHCCDSLNMLIYMQGIKGKWLNQLLPWSLCSTPYQKSAVFAAGVGNFHVEQLMCRKFMLLLRKMMAIRIFYAVSFRILFSKNFPVLYKHVIYCSCVSRFVTTKFQDFTHPNVLIQLSHENFHWIILMHLNQLDAYRILFIPLNFSLLWNHLKQVFAFWIV